MLSNGFSIIALVSEEEGDEASRPSNRIKALWRQFHMNYAAITEAADGLYRIIAGTVTHPSYEYQHNAYEGLRRQVAGITLVRYVTVPQNFEADDFETVVYEGVYSAWGLGSATEALKMLLEDADRATSRLAELVVQHEDRKLSRVVMFLTMLTIISVLYDLSVFTIPGTNIAEVLWTFIFTDKTIIMLLYVILSICIYIYMWKPKFARKITDGTLKLLLRCSGYVASLRENFTTRHEASEGLCVLANSTAVRSPAAPCGTHSTPRAAPHLAPGDMMPQPLRQRAGRGLFVDREPLLQAVPGNEIPRPRRDLSHCYPGLADGHGCLFRLKIFRSRSALASRTALCLS